MEDVQPLAKFIRLQNGDDLIADVIEMEDEKGILYTLFHPLKVVYVPSERDGYLAIAFAPWVFKSLCDQQEFVIHAEDVMLIVDASEKMNTYYWENVDHQFGNEPQKEEIPEEDGLDRLADILDQLHGKRTLH